MASTVMMWIARRKSIWPIRTFYISTIYGKAETNKSLTVVSQKTYAALPTTKLLSDGANACSLENWNGGLESKKIGEFDKAIFFYCSRILIEHITDEVKPLAEKRAENIPPEDATSTALSSSTGPSPQDPLPGIELKSPPQNQLAREIRDNLVRFPHCILLTRVGSFYESYFEQAVEVARLLSIKLTKRTWDKQEVLMCGFPIMHLEKYLKVLVQTNKRFVALCEEFKRNPPEEGFERRVVRVVTPGTLTEDSIVDPYENNFLLAIDNVSTEAFSSRNDVGLAWIDVSTGEFFTQKSNLEHLKDDLARISPREVVLSSKIKDHPHHAIYQAASGEECFISFCSRHQSDDTCFFSTPATEDTLEFHYTDSLSIHETSAISLLTSFLQDHLLEHMPILSSPSRQNNLHRMHIDSHTLKSLEVKERMREGGTTGSLVSVVKRTITSSGTRLLTRWLCEDRSPSTSIQEIQSRQSLVSFFLQRSHLRHDIIQYLRRLEDTSRIVQRFLLRKGDVSDLAAIKGTIELWQIIKVKIESNYTGEEMNDEYPTLRRLLDSMSDMTSLATRIELAVEPRKDSLNEEMTLPTADTIEWDNISSNNWTGQFKPTIRPRFSPQLTSLHTKLSESHAARQRLERELQERFDSPSLTLRLSGKMGVHVHLARPNRDCGKIENSSQFVILSSSASSKTFFNQTWYILGTQIIDITMQILAAEKDAFEILRHEVKMQVSSLRRNARIMDELDVVAGFAQLADDMKFVKPTLDASTSFEVVNGRHPSVEIGLLGSGRVFTPNTVTLSSASRMHIITGPNMAGKSTLLRQSAIVVILAQIGSFVPADSATLGVVDRLFSRIGAKDDLFRDRSTFMVEMLETADILRNATDRSLVIMDEVGRGTAVKDGLAIAFATVYHLYRFNRSRVLFATHFHELADMLGYTEQGPNVGPFNEIGFFCTDVHTTRDNYFTYSHRLRPGVNRSSHGLKVATLAGVPFSALEVAEDALKCITGPKSPLYNDQTKLNAIGLELISRHQ
ncbi:hypothetical protein Clacol_003637 [Clathrus columnatus]|uniref:DNA mismatch repair proteins mutS family domain-containing protein n=1 Tax=Clathrus columnatus TaxID=1419009 RepID=A0AAV5ABV8_9AGAM|nr:hypothetical protein Clacol_003637 [Clathrus columnatus]